MDTSEKIKKMQEGRLSSTAKQALFEAAMAVMNDSDRSYYQRLPKAYRLLLLKNYSNKTSKSTAIKCKCLDCSNFDRTKIINCTRRSCPLWNFRPFIKKIELQNIIPSKGNPTHIS